MEASCDLCCNHKSLVDIRQIYKTFIVDIITKITSLDSKPVVPDVKMKDLKLVCSKCNLKLYNFYSFVEMCRNSILYNISPPKNADGLYQPNDDSIDTINTKSEPKIENDEAALKINSDQNNIGTEIVINSTHPYICSENGVPSDDEKVKQEEESEQEEFLMEYCDENGIEGSKVSKYEDDFCADIQFDDEDIKPIIESCKEEIARKRRFKCNSCLKAFKSEKSLKNHQTKHNKDIKSYNCTFCKRTFKALTGLRNHQRTHESDRNFKCPVCEKVFSCATSLMRHEIIHRKDGTLSPLKPAKAKCSVCQGEFAAKYMDIHMRRHTGDRQFLCTKCPKQFHTKSLLKEHLKSHEERQNLCTICGRKFARVDQLRIHLKRHRGDKPHKCTYCGKGFARTADLGVHLLYHTDDKRHLCNLCGKGFHRHYNLKVHQRIHTGERPYKCEHCSQSFAQGYDLTTHVRRRHTGEKYNCDLCEVGFYQKYYLTRHKLKEHGIESNRPGRVKKFDASGQETNKDIKTESPTEQTDPPQSTTEGLIENSKE